MILTIKIAAGILSAVVAGYVLIVILALLMGAVRPKPRQVPFTRFPRLKKRDGRMDLL